MMIKYEIRINHKIAAEKAQEEIDNNLRPKLKKMSCSIHKDEKDTIIFLNVVSYDGEGSPELLIHVDPCCEKFNDEIMDAIR